MKLINTEKIIARINKNKDRPKKVTKVWIMSTYNLSKAEATKVKYAYDEQEMNKKIGKSGKKEDLEVEGIFSSVTEQEKIFCLEYLKSYNLRNAAVKAGYSPHTGARLIRKDSVSQALKAYQNMRESELFLSGLDIIRMYVGIAFADITDYVKFGTEEVPMLDGYGKEIYDKDGNLKMYTRSYVRLNDSDKIDGRFIQEVKLGKDGVSIKLFDKPAALDKLAKIYDIFNEKDNDKLKTQLLSAKVDVEKAKAKVLDVGEDMNINFSIVRASEKKKKKEAK